MLINYVIAFCAISVKKLLQKGDERREKKLEDIQTFNCLTAAGNQAEKG